MTVSTFSSVNQAANSMSLAVNILRVALIAAGWTQQGSGDGSTFSNAGAGPVTNGGSAATGLDGTGRWIRLRDPAGVREVIFFRGSSSAVWNVVYSYVARFTGGSPAAAQRPTASDEVTVVSTSTFGSTTPAYAHAIVEDTPINGVYGFWLIRTVQATSVRMDLLACDPLSSVADETRYGVIGSLIDPCVWLSFPATATPAGSNSVLSTTMQLLTSPALSGRALMPVTCTRLSSGNGSGNVMADASAGSQGMGANDYTTGDDLFAVPYARFVAQTTGIPGGLIGLSHHMSEKTIVARNYPDVVQHGVSDLAWVYYGGFAVPWPKGTAPSA